MRDMPREGEIFRHDDGTLEVVFAVTDGRILTVKEYDHLDAFDAATSEAVLEGVSEDVEELSLESFPDGDDGG